jgi:hypothetical protein
MAQTIKIKRSAVAGKAPVVGDLDLGELALNTYDGKLYTKKDNGTASVVELGAIDNDSVTYAKIQNVSATDKLLGRSSAGAGDIEEITCTAAGRALLDDADAAAQRTTLGLGTLATQSGTFSGTSSGTNTGDQTITLTGDVTGSGTGSFTTAIAAGAIVDADINASAGIADTKLATIATAGKVSNSATTAASANTTSAIVSRDASGNFAASTITAALNGNASTASILQTARSINGVSFNGSADITLTANTSNSLTFNNGGAGAVSGTAFTGALARTVSYNSIGAPSVTGTNASGTWGIAITGNAATATTLATARTINGISFNGSANINVPDLRADNGTVLIDGTGVTSAVNYISLTNAATAGAPTISTAGSDTNIGLNITTKGTGSVSISTAGGAILLRPGTSGVRIYDDSNAYYHSVATGTMTADRTLTLPNANVTLVGGTMVPTTGTGATGSWGISVTGNAATATTATNCSRSVIAGNGVTGGGALTADRTITLGTPSSITLSTTNSVTTGSHTHALDGINSGSYTPTASTFTNLDSVTIGASDFMYVRVGSGKVMVFGQAVVKATAVGNFVFRVTLPVTPTQFGNTTQCAGIGSARNGSEYSCTIQSVTSSTTQVVVNGYASTTVTRDVHLSFCYFL